MYHDPKNVNRRQHFRCKKHFIIRFSRKDNPAIKYEVSQTENISQGGLCFTSSMPIQAGTELIMELRTPYLAGALFLEGKVLESVEKVKGIVYRSRVQFSSLLPQAVEVLTKIEESSIKETWN